MNVTATALRPQEDTTADTGRVVVCDPADGTTVTDLPSATEEDVAAAVATARHTAPSWARTPAGERGGLLHRAADAVAARADELARLVTREMGKPLGDARGGVDAAVGTLR